jgi:hypothetical protein
MGAMRMKEAILFGGLVLGVIASVAVDAARLAGL